MGDIFDPLSEGLTPPSRGTRRLLAAPLRYCQRLKKEGGAACCSATFTFTRRWSDGRLAVGEVVDLFGRSGHDVIAITDHVVNTDSFLGKAAHRLGSVTRRSGTTTGRDRVRGAARLGHVPDDRPRRRRADAERLHGKASAHALALGVDDFSPTDGSIEAMLDARPRRRGRRGRLPPERAVGVVREHVLSLEPEGRGRGLVHLWELACRWDLFPPVGGPASRSSATATSTAVPHLWAWKTLLDCEKRPEAVLGALRKGRGSSA